MFFFLNILTPNYSVIVLGPYDFPRTWSPSERSSGRLSRTYNTYNPLTGAYRRHVKFDYKIKKFTENDHKKLPKIRREIYGRRCVSYGHVAFVENLTRPYMVRDIRLERELSGVWAKEIASFRHRKASRWQSIKNGFVFISFFLTPLRLPNQFRTRACR